MEISLYTNSTPQRNIRSENFAFSSLLSKLTDKDQVIALARVSDIPEECWMQRFEQEGLPVPMYSLTNEEWMKFYTRSVGAEYKTKEYTKILENSHIIKIDLDFYLCFSKFDLNVDVFLQGALIMSIVEKPYYLYVYKEKKIFHVGISGYNAQKKETEFFSLINTSESKLVKNIIYVSFVYAMEFNVLY